MSLAQNDTLGGMKYEVAGKKEVSDPKAVERKLYANSVNQTSSLYTLWLLAWKHRVGLLAMGNVILVLNWAIPEWPTMLRSIF